MSVATAWVELDSLLNSKRSLKNGQDATGEHVGRNTLAAKEDHVPWSNEPT